MLLTKEIVFKFEEEFYAKRGLKVDFVGHPLLDIIKIHTSRDSILQSAGFPLNKLTIGILPGSRHKEVETLLPIMLQSAKILYQENNKIQFLLLKASTVSDETIQKYTQNLDIPIKTIKDQTYDGINASDLCMVASGTATLETAILQKPMVVVYKTSLLTYWLAKIFVQIPYIGLVNVIAGKRIVP